MKSGYYYARARPDVTPASFYEAELCGFVLRMTEGFEVALHALRLSRLANAAAVPNELVREEDPLFSRNRLHQVLFDLLRVVVAGEVKALRETLHVRVHHDSGSDAERCS